MRHVRALWVEVSSILRLGRGGGFSNGDTKLQIYRAENQGLSLIPEKARERWFGPESPSYWYNTA
jgi:hypothetical protein